MILAGRCFKFGSGLVRRLSGGRTAASDFNRVRTLLAGTRRKLPSRTRNGPERTMRELRTSSASAQSRVFTALS